MKTRNSNIELLRIISTLFIITGHLVAQTDVAKLLTSYNSVWTNHPLYSLLIAFIGGGCRIAVSMYLLIGSWFMIDSKFKASRITNIYFQTWFCNNLITLIVIICGFYVSKIDLAKSLFPFVLRSPWYTSSYIILIITAPFIDIIASKNKRLARILLITSFYTVFFMCSIQKMQDTWLCTILGFVGYYIVTYYYKKYLINFFDKYKKQLLIISLLIYVMLILCEYMPYILNNDKYIIISEISNQYLGDYKSIPNFICAFGIFNYFINIKENNNNIINNIAKPTFTVYLIHQSPCIIPYIWNDIFHIDMFYQKSYFIIYLLLVVAIIYFVGYIIEKFRLILHKYFRKTKLYHLTITAITNIFSPTISIN